jgi:hypothetical protein
MIKKVKELAERMVHGTILTPGELQAAAQGLKQRPELNGYAITGWVSEAEAALLEDQQMERGVRFTLYPLPCGVLVAVSTFQAGPMQLRWFVPLVDERPRAWLQWSIAHSTVAALLEVGDGRQVTWCHLPLPFDRRAELEELLAQPITAECADAFTEAAAVNAHFAQDDAVPSCVPGVQVTQVRVVAVCDGLYDALRARVLHVAN